MTALGRILTIASALYLKTFLSKTHFTSVLFIFTVKIPETAAITLNNAP